MKHKIVAISILSLVLALILAGCAQPAKIADLKACSSISYPPFEYYVGSDAVGFDVDLWNEIGKRMNTKTSMDNIPWDGLIPALLGNKCNAIISMMGETPERAKQVDFSAPYFNSAFSLAVQAKSGIQGLGDLKGKKMGVQTGVTSEQWARAEASNLGFAEIIPYDEAPDQILDLQSGRLDVIVQDTPYLLYQLKDKPELRVLPMRVGQAYQAKIVFRPNDDQLREQVNKVLAEIIKDGTWAKIYQKWFGVAPSAEDIPSSVGTIQQYPTPKP